VVDNGSSAPLPAAFVRRVKRGLWNIPASKRLGASGARCFMRTNRTPDERNKWCLARERIADELKGYYQVCTTGELAPQLIALSKKLHEELLKSKTDSAVGLSAASRHPGLPN
jgi:hypothetical protein